MNKFTFGFFLSVSNQASSEKSSTLKNQENKKENTGKNKATTTGITFI